MRYLLSLVLAVVLSFTSLFAQDKLKGVVMEESEKGKFMPLIGVNVYWNGTQIGAVTDTNGFFNIDDDHSNHVLIISYIGYQSDTVEVSNHKNLMIVLKNALEMDQVEIIHRRKSTSLSAMDSRHVEVLSEKELFKAACCNLSESFETNASVDASFTDAVSGNRQIQMLGLSGIYTQMITENLPTTRGLASVYGLTYIPGAWIDQINISKGTGSVVNGYESITGQINTELRKPEQDERFFFNAYGNQSGRLEANIDYKLKLNEKWSTSFLLHGRALNKKNDKNDDGFLDMPLNQTFIGMNRWKYIGISGLRSQFGVKYIDILNQGGQKFYEFDKENSTQSYWGTEMKTQRLEGFLKLGYVFSESKYNSIGLQVFGVNHHHESFYGRRIYNADEQSMYGNLIFQTIVNNTDHKIKYGLSYMYDNFDENLDATIYERTEYVPGAFLEYTWLLNANMTLVAGMRADYHNIYDWIYSPRLNYRYAFTESSTLRIAAGMGSRVANVLAENSGYMASSRKYIIPGNNDAFGLEPEKAINMGISLQQKFKLDYRDGSFVIDYYRTEFLNQVVVDVDENPQEVNFYNLNGQSFANSFQAELNYELIKRLDFKIAYRYYDVQTDYNSGLLDKPLLAKHKGFLNLAYETKLNKKFGNWKFDATLQFIGEQRIPYTQSNPEEYQLDEYSPSFALLSAQITKVFNKSFEIYLGSENLTNYKQEDPIVSADDPYGPNFDASMIWAPIFGTNVYGGLRYKIK